MRKEGTELLPATATELEQPMNWKDGLNTNGRLLEI